MPTRGVRQSQLTMSETIAPVSPKVPDTLLQPLVDKDPNRPIKAAVVQAEPCWSVSADSGNTAIADLRMTIQVQRRCGH